MSARLELEKPIPLNYLTDVFEADAEDEDMFLAGLGGKDDVFKCIINGVCVEHPELVLCLESEGTVVLFHLAYMKKGDRLKMVKFSFPVLNHLIRMCLLPFLEGCWNASFSFVEDCFVPGGRPSVNKKEYEFTTFMKETIKNFLYTTAETATEDAEEMVVTDIDKSTVYSSKLRGMILGKNDTDMLMDKFGVDKIRCGSNQSTMIRCTNKGHEDMNPSMSLKLTAMAWRLSDKIEVSKEMDKKLMELYRCDRTKRRDGDPFVFISDNAVKDTSSGRIYVLYTIKRYCFSCRNES